MEIKYKPTKPKKEKPIKAPKAEKAAKPMSFGSAQSVKIDKPRKVKEPKPAKAPKPEKTVSFSPTKVEKATDFKSSGKLPKSVNTKVLAIVLSVVAVVAVAIAVIPFLSGLDSNSDIPAVKPESMVVSALPDKTVYYVGDEPTWYGLKVDVTLDNGMTVSMNGTDCEITGFDSSAPVEKQTVFLTYKGCIASFDVKILGTAQENGPSGAVTGLSFKTLPKTEYKVGEYKSVAGGVLLLQYEDGTTEEITLHYENIYDFTTDAPGTYEVKVKLLKEGKLYTTTYTITVTE